MAILGIDYGSSYTTVSWINPRHGKPEAVKFNGDGSVKYPSVILGYNNGLVSGYQALNYLEEVDKLPSEKRFDMLANFIPSLKRILNPKGIEFIGDKEYTHKELLEFFFKQVKQMTNAHCGYEVDFDSVVISHPVDCEESTIQMLRQALSASGFKEVKTQFEPIAAVMGYGIDHDIPEGQGILVFDFGGGTIDVAYAKKHLGSYRILCEPKGDKSCGGQDIDMLLYEDLRKKVLTKYDMDISKGNMVDLGMLNSCRRLKEHFSDSNDIHETSIVFVKDGRINTYKYKLNRDSFNNIISQKIADAINVAKAVIKQTEAKQLKIDKVLLIGGSSQLTLVRQMLFEVLPETLIDTCGEKDIAVALGNIAEETGTKKVSSNDIINPNRQDEKSDNILSMIDRNRAILCPSCGSKECYHHAEKIGYYCLNCGYDGPNVKVTIIR